MPPPEVDAAFDAWIQRVRLDATCLSIWSEASSQSRPSERVAATGSKGRLSDRRRSEGKPCRRRKNGHVNKQKCQGDRAKPQRRVGGSTLRPVCIPERFSHWEDIRCGPGSSRLVISVGLAFFCGKRFLAIRSFIGSCSTVGSSPDQETIRMTRQTSGMAAIPPRMNQCLRHQIGTDAIKRGLALCASPNTRISEWKTSEIASRIRIKNDARSIKSNPAQSGRNRSLDAARCALTEFPFLKRLTKKAALAVAAISFAATAFAASDVAASAPESGSLAGIARQGVLRDLEVWKIPGSALKLLVGSRDGEVLIAKLISPPKNWSAGAENVSRPLDADELCAVEDVLTGHDPTDLNNRDVRDLPETLQIGGQYPNHAASKMSLRPKSAVHSNATEYSRLVELDELPSEASGSPIDRSIALESIRKDAFWFSVGKRGAPTAYAIIDPDCPFCAKAMTNLKDEVELGKLQLRVVPVPALGGHSADLIAAVLTDKEPPVAFWRHEIQKGTFGASDLAPADFMSLRPELRAAIESNLALVSRLKIEGVPFFAFETSDGPAVYFGVPEPNIFANALPDPYDGGSNRTD